MSIEKNFLKSKPECKVTFSLEKDACFDAKTVTVVGDFNDWDKEAHPLKKNKDGNFKTAINLEVGKHYQFRYLIDGKTWINDWHADYYAPTEYNSENSVVTCVE